MLGQAPWAALGVGRGELSTAAAQNLLTDKRLGGVPLDVALIS